MSPHWFHYATAVSALLLCFLPVPVRTQSSVPVASPGNQVQFSPTSASCTACRPAFNSAACKQILDSIQHSSTAPISNSTLTSCQCTGPFLSLYNTCVQCFTETDQMDLVFGSNRAPALASLEAFCKSAPIAVPVLVTTHTPTLSKDKNEPSVTLTATPIPTNPSSATAKKPLMALSNLATALLLGWVSTTL
ncbi:hypothetical protein BGZ52_008135 [Haplosporangium bisporale]|nr:hypothetical protein BGZ52_008135 [Haplosporangium bisporale]KAI9239493.1 MAG: hypothetical protein BYD32DRAFT_411024 [Podila humilis]KFH67704.1 hypothetical protein MVEG_06436 [Podila verticillata NRRL 6337]